MSPFSMIEAIAQASSRLSGVERGLFDDLFVEGLSPAEVQKRRGMTQQQWDAAHGGLMRSLCGVTDQAGSSAGRAA